MFCPKCGTQNPETGRFCRNCGADLSSISKALAGDARNSPNNFGMTFQPIQPIQPLAAFEGKGKQPSLESVLSTIFTGLAMLIVSIILGVTGIAGGKFWWFWLLIPAFGAIGTGIAQFIQLRKIERKTLPNAEPPPPAAKSFDRTTQTPLPPIQTEYAAPAARYQTDDLVPPSVVENTTRHLEMNSEGETMTLPKK